MGAAYTVPGVPVKPCTDLQEHANGASRPRAVSQVQGVPGDVQERGERFQNIVLPRLR